MSKPVRMSVDAEREADYPCTCSLRMLVAGAQARNTRKELSMRRLLPAVLLGLAAVVLGCQPAPKTAALPPEPAPMPEPVFDVRPETWAKGQVFRVWHYGQGEMMAYLGAKDGLKKGDILILQRDGTPVNTIEALKVNEDTFYGRVYERQEEALLPRVGDMAVRGPQPKMREAPAQGPETAPGPKAAERR